MREDGKVESTLSVSRAVLRHKGKYKCNINHANSFDVHVQRAPPTIESAEIEESFSLYEPENDHEDQRMRFESPVDDVKVMLTTTINFMIIPTESARIESSDIGSFFDDYDDKSREKYIDEPSTFNGFFSPEFEVTSPVVTTTSSPEISLTSLPSLTSETSLTNIPFHAHPTHETTRSNHVVHTTHVIPSEVKTQNHPEQHLHKGSQYKK